MHIFKGHGTSALDIQLNTIHFPADRKIMLGSCSSYRYVNYAGFLLTLFQALSEVIPTMNFLSQESQEWAVNSSVHLVSKISFTIKLQSYIK